MDQALPDNQTIVVDATRPIIDSHHHLWEKSEGRYLSAEAFADIFQSGHNVVASVYVECGAMFRKDGPPPMRTVGEADYVREVAAMGARGEVKPRSICAAFVASADLALGEEVDDVFAALDVASGGRLRGVRGSAVWDPDPSVNSGSRPFAPRHMLLDSRFRAGFARLSRHNLVYDAWQYYPQLPDVADLAGAFPDTTIIVNHCGGLLGVGAYATPENFAHWRARVAEVARRDNVLMKLGGLSGRRCGFGFGDGRPPADAPGLVTLWRPYVETCIELFGPKRCMFESNYPVDRVSGSYAAIWNAFQIIAAGYSAAEQDDLFFGAAQRAYRIEAPR